MDFCDVPAGKLHHCGRPMVSSIRSNQNRNSRRLRLRNGFIEVGNFVARDFSTVGIRKVAVSHENREQSEARLNTNPAKRFGGAPDFDSRRSGNVGYELTVRESEEGLHKLRGSPR